MIEFRFRAPRAESGPIFNFYMGKNTPERKDYIMDKLVVPVEEKFPSRPQSPGHLWVVCRRSQFRSV